MAHPEVTSDYTSPSADTTSFSASAPARWIACYGAGTIVMLDNSATPASKTYVVTGSEVISGEWTALVSTTCTRIRIGTSQPAPQPFPFPSAVNLAGGAAAVTGVLPASQAQDFVDAGTVFGGAFSAIVNTMHPFAFAVTAANINFPKITAAINGLSIAIMNLGTGATASVLVPSGTDSMGVVGVGVTAATAAGPKSAVAQRWTGCLTTGQWSPAI